MRNKVQQCASNIWTTPHHPTIWPSDDSDDGGGEQTQARYWPKLPSDKLALISVAYSQINTGFTILQAYLVVVIREILLLKFEI